MVLSDVTKCHHGHHLLNLTSSDFWSNYAYHMLLALGYRIKSQITINTLQKIIDLSLKSQGKPYSTNECYLKLTAIYSRALRNYFFDINQEFDSISNQCHQVLFWINGNMYLVYI